MGTTTENPHENHIPEYRQDLVTKLWQDSQRTNHPLRPGWQEYKDELDTWYHNASTGESQWERPNQDLLLSKLPDVKDGELGKRRLTNQALIDRLVRESERIEKS